jgi:hypothetical protein
VILSRGRFMMLLLAAAIATIGCSGNPPVDAPPSQTDENLMRLASLYGNYVTKNKGKVPGSTEELKKWVSSLPPEELSKLEIADVDALFISPRDNQPYQLAKPTNPMAAKMGAQKIIFYEKEGVGGKHMVVGGMGTRPREITRDELKQEVPDFSG